MPNVTHAPALIGLERGYFTDVDARALNAGPAIVEALFAGALDAAYVGPSPAINAFVRSRGEAIRIVSGSTSGGASLVVREGIETPDDLRGKILATPQLGNTQDVALRTWLSEHGLSSDTRGGGEVSIRPQENSQTLEAFRSGEIDGAWLPEPWVSRLVIDAGAKVLVDERSLWPDGQFASVQLVVRTDFLARNRAAVKSLVESHLRAIEKANEPEARLLTTTSITRATGTRLQPEVVELAWTKMSFTHDPIPASLAEMARDARSLGFIPSDDVDGIYELSVLEEVLGEHVVR